MRYLINRLALLLSALLGSLGALSGQVSLSPLAKPVYQTGEVVTVEVTGLGAWNPCDSILFEKVDDGFSFGLHAATFQNGSPSELEFPVPPDLECGNYNMTVVQDACSTSTVPSNAVQVEIRDSVEISYSAGPVFCVGADRIMPSISTDLDHEGLYFFQKSGRTDLVLNSSTGEIGFHQGAVGIDAIIMGSTSDTSSACFDADTFALEVKAMDNFVFYYGSQEGPATFCSSAVQGQTRNPTTAATIPAGGTFSITADASSALDPSTGRLTLGDLPVGSYTVTFEGPAESCYAPSSTTITIEPGDSMVFEFPESICASQGTVAPAISNLVAGGAWEVGTVGGGAAGLSVSAAGIVSWTSAVSPGNSVWVRYSSSLASSCLVPAADTFQLLESPDPAFAPNSMSFCQSVGTTSLTGLGSFFEVPDLFGTQFLDLDPSGNLDLANSVPGGPYAIYHLLEHPVTGCKDSAWGTISIVGSSALEAAYPAEHFCQSEGNLAPLLTSGALDTQYGSFYANPPLPLPWQITSSPSTSRSPGLGYPSRTL